jgi:hypothetical protein
VLVGILHWTFIALFGFDLSFSTLELSKFQYFIRELEKGIVGLGRCI